MTRSGRRPFPRGRTFLASLRAVDFITVATFPDLPEAELAKERLTLEGVDAFVRHSATVGTMPFLTGSEGGIHVQVAPADEERARAILGT